MLLKQKMLESNVDDHNFRTRKRLKIQGNKFLRVFETTFVQIQSVLACVWPAIGKRLQRAACCPLHDHVKRRLRRRR